MFNLIYTISESFKAPAAALHRQLNKIIQFLLLHRELMSCCFPANAKCASFLQRRYLGACCRCVGSSRWSSMAGVSEIIIIKSVHTPVTPEEGRPSSCTPERIRILIKVRPSSLIRISRNRKI